jgi:hypothetical protein
VKPIGASVVLCIVAVVVFVLAAFGVTFGSFGELDMVALGAAIATAARVVP